MNRSTEEFNKKLQFGGRFEDIIEPRIAQIFTMNLDPLSAMVNTATSKTDHKHNRGQRLMYTHDRSISYMLPDIQVYGAGKQYSVEIKCKNRYYTENNETYALIDYYKIVEYDSGVKIMYFDGIYYVFGENKSRTAHMTKLNGAGGEIKFIPCYADNKNKTGKFMAWNIKDLQYIGTW
jgi:hypothetical protein